MFTSFKDNTDIKEIRNYIDPTSGILYLSVVDIIKILELSSDPRNYWKTLKNRLNKRQDKLVTKCNQLKMTANDGKKYMTDVIDGDNMLLLIQEMAPEKVGKLRVIFEKIEKESSTPDMHSLAQNIELSTAKNRDYELMIDGYENKDMLVIHAMLAGVEPEDIFILANYKNILLKGRRKSSHAVNQEGYVIQELFWGEFSKEIILPAEANIEEIETKFHNGVLEIKIPKIDREKTKIIKIKS